MGEGQRDGGFVKNFVARLNAAGGNDETSPPRSVSTTPSGTRAGINRTRSVIYPEDGALQLSFRSREVGDKALPTVIKGTRGADGASMPLRPSPSRALADPEHNSSSSRKSSLAEEQPQATAANARAFWEAKSRPVRSPALSKKAGSQLMSFSSSCHGENGALAGTSNGTRSASTLSRSSAAAKTVSAENAKNEQRAVGRESLPKVESKAASAVQVEPKAPATVQSISQKAEVTARVESTQATAPVSDISSLVSPVKAKVACAPVSDVSSLAGPAMAIVESTPASAPVSAPVSDISSLVGPAKVECSPAVEDEKDEQLDEESDADVEVEDSSEGETAGGYSIGGADDDSDAEKNDANATDDNDEDEDEDECDSDSSVEGAAGGYSFGAASDDDDDNEETAPAGKEDESTEAVLVSSVKPSEAIWPKLTTGCEFAAPPVRRRRNIEGEMEEEVEDKRVHYIGFNDVVTVFEDDLAGAQHLYAFLFNW